MRLLGDRLLVQPIKPPATLGGIFLPQSIQDDYNTGGVKQYLVLQVGPGWTHKSGKVVPMECKVGDRVLCHSYTAGPTELPDGSKIITYDQVVAVIPNHEPDKQS